MSIGNTKLATKYPAVADDLENLYLEGERSGAKEGSQRLLYICEQYDQLTPNTAYLWLDPGAVQFEIEEAQLHKFGLEFLRIVRHICSLAPLIATWTALFFAVNAYQQYLQEAGNAADKTSFLQLWEGGFHGLSRFTFTVAAGLDIIFLLSYLIVILIEQGLERRAHLRAIAFTTKLQHKVKEILDFVVADGVMHVSDQADIDKVVTAVRLVVDGATDSVKQTMETTRDSIKQLADDTSKAAQQSFTTFEQAFNTGLSDMQAAVKQSIDTSTQSITGSNTRVETIFTQQIIPLLTEFHQDTQTLHTELGNYQGRLDDLTKASDKVATASDKLADASKALTDNAYRYVDIGENIRGSINKLDTTQNEMVEQVRMVASGISSAAGHMASTTGDMTHAISNIENLADTLERSVQKTVAALDQGVQTTVNAVTAGVANASISLKDVAPRLDGAADALSQTTGNLQQDLIPTLTVTIQALQQTTTALQQASEALASIRLGTLLFGRRGRSSSSRAGTPPPPPAYPTRQQSPVTLGTLTPAGKSNSYPQTSPGRKGN